MQQEVGPGDFRPLLVTLIVLPEEFESEDEVGERRVVAVLLVEQEQAFFVAESVLVGLRARGVLSGQSADVQRAGQIPTKLAPHVRTETFDRATALDVCEQRQQVVLRPRAVRERIESLLEGLAI